MLYHPSVKLFLTMLCACLVLRAASASADEAADRAQDLVEEGARLGGAGRFDEAIDRFRQAEAILPRAIHDCNIGLAFARSGRPAQANFFLTRCRARATDALPAWVDARLATLAETLQSGSFAQVTIAVEPVGAAVVAEGFLPDDLASAPSPIWLPFGDHELVASRPGMTADRERVTVDTRDPRMVRLALAPPPVTLPVDTATAQTATPPTTRSASAAPRAIRRRREGPDHTWAWITTGTGVAILGGGAAMHVVASRTRSRAEELPAGAAFDDELEQFQGERFAAVALYATGAIVTGIGVFLFTRGGGEDVSALRMTNDQ